MKTETSYRKVSIPDSVTNLLKKYKVEHNEKRLRLGDKWQGADVVSNDFIFCTWEGKPAHPDSLNNWLRKFTIKHNIPHIIPHAFRHMNATYLIAGGVNVRTVSGKLGHSKPSTTSDIYSHLVQAAEQRTANVMEEFLQKSAKKGKQKIQAE